MGLVMLGGCLSQDQFFGTYGNGANIVGSGRDSDVQWRIYQQSLTAYDFWGESPGGGEFWVEASNSSSETRCVLVHLGFGDTTIAEKLNALRFQKEQRLFQSEQLNREIAELTALKIQNESLAEKLDHDRGYLLQRGETKNVAFVRFRNGSGVQTRVTVASVWDMDNEGYCVPHWSTYL